MKTPGFPHVVTRRKFVGQLAVGATALALADRIHAEAAPQKKLGVALVGLGSYARGQLGPALKVTENCRLMGVVTGSKEKGQKWASDYEFPEANIWNYDTMHQIADNKDTTIVYVVTPNSLHAEEVIIAAKAG